MILPEPVANDAFFCKDVGLLRSRPVILDDEGEERWRAGDLEGLVEPFPSQLMTVTQA